MSAELNPNHVVTATMRDQWHKVVALMLVKSGEKEVVLTAADIERLSDGFTVVAQEERDGLHIYLVDHPTAMRLAREAGGLPT